jgi:hypothetical protein
MSLLAELKRRNVLDMDVLRSHSTWTCVSDQHVALTHFLTRKSGVKE